jgi:hypothetical protein
MHQVILFELTLSIYFVVGDSDCPSSGIKYLPKSSSSDSKKVRRGRSHRGLRSRKSIEA